MAHSHSFQNILEIETTEESKGKERRICETSTVVKIRVIKQHFYLMRIFADSKINLVFLRDQRDTFP